MWKKSKPKDYNSFRTFIFGITKQSMFPRGVVYEGVSEEPMSFRGESGANDSMVRSYQRLERQKLTKYARSPCATTFWRSVCRKHPLQKSCKIFVRIVQAITVNF